MQKSTDGGNNNQKSKIPCSFTCWAELFNDANFLYYSHPYNKVVVWDITRKIFFKKIKNKLKNKKQKRVMSF